MITWKEMLKNKKLEDLPVEHQYNLNVLFHKINELRAIYGKPMIPTSTYRSIEEHLDIYAKKGITDLDKIPMKSKHLFGKAIDIADKEGKLYQWCKDNEYVLKKLEFYCEEGTVGWVHFQTEAPASGNRWFLLR